MKPELLPSGIQQVIVFVLEEIRVHVRNGQISAKKQLQQASYLPPADRQRMMPILSKQLEHWQKSEGVVDYILAKIQQRQRWIPTVKQMTEMEMIANGIDTSLREVMGWVADREQQTA